MSAHYFTLPTLTENFGYVFIEALAAGCPLLISDRTEWNSIEPAGAGWILPLNEPEAWTRQIVSCVEQNQIEYDAMSAASRLLAVKWLAEPSHEEDMAKLFAYAVAQVKSVAVNG